MLKSKSLNLSLLLFIIALNASAASEENEFINAMKNINLQGLDSNKFHAETKASLNNSEENNIEFKAKLEKKNENLQLKYEKLLGAYNEIKLKDKPTNPTNLNNTIAALTAEKEKLILENSLLNKRLNEANSVQSVLRKEGEQSATKQQNDLATLSQQNTRLTAEADAARKQLAEATSALAALRKEGEQSATKQQNDLATLSQQNTRLTAEADAARKQLAEATSALAALRKEGEQSATKQQNDLATLSQQNTRLTAEADAARKQLAEATSALAALRKEGEQSATKQQNDLATLSQQNTRLTAEADAARKQLAEATSALTALRKQDELTENAKNEELKTIKGRKSYSLGVFYYDMINKEFEKIKKSNIDLTPSMMISGVNDAYYNSLRMKKDKIMENVLEVDRVVQSVNSEYAKKILKYIKKKPYEVLSNGSFLVTEKSTSDKYVKDSVITFDMIEKKMDGKPILNTMNTKIKLEQVKDPLLEKIISKGGRGGIVSLYGKAGVLYKNIPDGVEPESLISITFKLK
ncbi:Chromosome partition protein Smc [Klebsiella spallanzanii]|uniref:Chromosome partition protein Smc n=1 Tax=Klebsiella spallanzanii TaxID=2587528 RepID=A0ABY6VHQ5_9ENTR|nr:hypothetical protein [Klebsiella spallanzanii]VUS85142.1 Chromosome partition protein Smc [Klebsiella spallanzanii]